MLSQANGQEVAEKGERERKEKEEEEEEEKNHKQLKFRVEQYTLFVCK